MGFRRYIGQCIVYSPETFSSHNELCRRAELQSQATKPKNAIDSGSKALKATYLLPSHEIAKPLIIAYFNTWERAYRVMHRESFRKEYHDGCIGIKQMPQCTDEYADPKSGKGRVERIPAWTECVENYCSLLVENHRLDLTALQTLCLFTLHKGTAFNRQEARRCVQHLIKCALRAKLHVDPLKLEGMSIFEIELRRRLRATILEIDIQVSLEHGNALPWTADIHHDVLEPSNLDDVDLHPHSRLTPDGKSSKAWSDCSLQRSLYSSAKLRIQLLKEIIRSEDREQKHDADLLSQIAGPLLKRLDGSCCSSDISGWKHESKLLLRLHILRTSLRVQQYLLFAQPIFVSFEMI